MLSVFFRLKLNYRHIVTKLIVSLFCCFLLLPIQGQQPKIIHFGWDNPDIRRLFDSIGLMQNTPFDGICVSFQEYIMEAFDTSVQPDSYFMYDKLRCIQWGKYTDNYLFLRGISKSGGSWFDDKAWMAISKNMNSISKAIKIGKLKGILFDAECYYEDPLANPWTYSNTKYPNHSFNLVQDKVRERGIQFIKSLQKYSNDFSFLSIWLSSLVAEDLKLSPFQETRHALLIAFMEGILLGKNENVKLIDGNENAYWYSKPSHFLASADYLKKNTINLMRSAKAKKLAINIKIAQPVYYDGILARHSSLEKGITVPDKWKWLEENLKYAIATSNSNVVWFYNERINWWRDNINDTLIDILKNSKTDFINNVGEVISKTKKTIQPKVKNINTGMGYYYYIEQKKPMKTGNIAFKYSWNKKNNTLNLKYINKFPSSVSIYINNTLSVIFKPTGLESSLNLKDFVLGKRLGILAHYEDMTEASALQGY